MRGRSDIVVIALAALAAGLPLLGPWALGGHDSFISNRAHGIAMAASFRDGVLLPAWAPELNYGFGGPSLILYPPLANAVHALTSFAFPMPRAIGIAALIGWFLSGLSMRLLLRDRVPHATAGAVAYMLAPYRFIDVYERTALSEHWAFVWPPLIVYALTREELRRPMRIALVALAGAGLLLTNLAQALLFTIVLALFVLAKRAHRIDAAAGLLLALGISLFALAPLTYADTWLDTHNWFGAKSTIPAIKNVLFSGDPFNHRVSMALAVTLAAALVAAIAGARTIWIAIAAGAFLFMLSPFGPLWDAMPALSRIQYPWRLGGVITFGAAIAIGLVRSRLAAWMLVALLCVEAVPNYGSLLLPMERFEKPHRLESRLVDPWLIMRGVPREMVWRMGYAKEPRLGPIEHRPAIVEPEGTIHVVRWERLRRELLVDAPRGGAVVWHSFAFPGMVTRVDGRAVPWRVNRAGFLTVDVPSGRPSVTWQWTPTTLMRVSRAISLAALLAAVMLAFAGRATLTPVQ